MVSIFGSKTAVSQDKPLTKSQLLKVVGDPGTERYSGYFKEEPSPIWQDSQRAEIVEEMRRTDATVKAALNALKAPILATTWSVETADDTPEGEELREFVEKGLFAMSGRTWKEFLREALTYFDFGFSVFEEVWAVKEGKIVLQDLEPRIQSSIQNWKLDDGRAGIYQQVSSDEVENSNMQIPMDKLLVLTNDKEGVDYTGQSVLKSAYKHYYYKDKLYRISAISAERYGVGVPVVTLPSGAGEEEQAEAEAMGRQLRANERSYIVLPSENWQITILTPEGNPHGDAIEKQVAHHDRMILMSMLATFLNLGSDSAGSYALSKDQSSFFLKHVEDKAVYVAEQIQKQVITRMLYYGFKDKPSVMQKLEDGLIPKLTFASLGDIDYKEMSEVLKNLSDTGMIKKGGKLTDWTHKTFKLPELSDKEREEINEQPEEEVAPEEEVMSEHHELAEKKKLEFWRELTEPEKRVDFHLLNETFNVLEQELEDELVLETEDSFNKALDKTERLLNAGDLAGLAALSVFSVNKIKAILKDKMKKANEVGKKTASDEIEVELPSTSTMGKQVINFDAEQYAQDYKTEVEREIKQSGKESIAKGVATAAAIGFIANKLRDKSSKMISNISGTVIGQNINRGRMSVFEANTKNISGFQRSEILDSRTCNVCMSLDKRIVEVDDPFAKVDLIHTHCRGSWVALKLEDGKVEGIYGIPKTVKKQFETIGGVPTTNNFKQLKKPINKANEDVQAEIKKRLS